MIRRTLSKEQIEKEPWQVWNSFVDLVAIEEYNDLTATQKVASAIFWYNSEVQNGGHMQYLANHGIEHLRETINAFYKIGNKHFLPLLSEANKIYNTLDLEGIEDVDEYVDMALDDHFGECDAKFYNIEPTLYEILEEYLKDHQSEFIEIR
jgi:hypothetical protein